MTVLSTELVFGGAERGSTGFAAALATRRPWSSASRASHPDLEVRTCPVVFHCQAQPKSFRLPILAQYWAARVIHRRTSRAKRGESRPYIPSKRPNGCCSGALLGGYGHSLSLGQPYDLQFAAESIEVRASCLEAPIPAMADQANDPEFVVPLKSLTDIEIGGRGILQTGGGFIGGGIGSFTGAAEGMAVASLLNRLTTKSSIETVMEVRWAEGSMIFHYGRRAPDAVRIWLAPELGTIRQRSQHNNAAPAVELATPVEQLERLGSLHERGLLTADEFAAAKQLILHGPSGGPNRTV